jgi:hypothetical protein
MRHFGQKSITIDFPQQFRIGNHLAEGDLMFNVLDAIRRRLRKKTQVRAVRRKSYLYNGHKMELSHRICDLRILTMSMPSTFRRGRYTYVQDRTRSCALKLTPEECVRQKTVEFLHVISEIPKENIKTEESLRHQKVKCIDRMDILVLTKDKGKYINLLLIECKKPNINVVGGPLQQVLGYHGKIKKYAKPKYIMVTNGKDSLIYHYVESQNAFEPLGDLPNFQTMLAENHLKSTEVPEPEFQRPALRELLDDPELQKEAKEEGIVGEDTSGETAALTTNLFYCLLDPKESFRDGFAGHTFTLMNDFGLADRFVGNASGGAYDLTYRWLAIKDRNRHVRNLFLTVCGEARTVHDPKYGNRKGQSIILIAVEKNTTPIPILQISLDKWITFSNGVADLHHDGRKSQTKSTKVIEYVNSICPALLSDEKTISLGSLDNSKLLSLTGEAEEQLFANLIDYALLRYELHQKTHNSKKSYQLRKKKLAIKD